MFFLVVKHYIIFGVYFLFYLSPINCITTLPEFSVIREMPGVGDVLAPRIIAEIGDVRRFHSASALIAYAGIDTPPYESGDFRASNRKITKRGSASLRKTGYEIIQALKVVQPQNDNAVYQYLIKKKAKGNH